MAKIRMKSGSEGPRHDPYSWSEIHFTKTDGTEVMLRAGGLGYTRLFVNGEKISESFIDDKSTDEKFEELVGMSPYKCEDVYYRKMHVEDPMGPASRYI